MQHERMQRGEATARRRTLVTALAGVVTFGTAVFTVWSLGFDIAWAVAAVLALLPVGAGIATVSRREHAQWEPSSRGAARGAQLSMAALEESMAACERLARHDLLRRFRPVITAERSDRLARLQLVRRLRALLIADLHEEGIDAAAQMATALARAGPHARAILQPHDSTPITMSIVAQCLDAVEQGAHSTPSSP